MNKDLYKYEYELSYIDKNTKENIKSNLIDNEKELYFYYYKKNNDDMHILEVIEKKNKIFTVKEEINKK